MLYLRIVKVMSSIRRRSSGEKHNNRIKSTKLLTYLNSFLSFTNFRLPSTETCWAAIRRLTIRSILQEVPKSWQDFISRGSH